MKKVLLCLALAAIGTAAVGAQLISSSPSPLFQGSENVVLTYRPNDSESNKQLANLTESTQIYAHIGVITSTSKNDDDWKHASDWNKNEDKYLMTYKAANTYELNIGNLKDYFSLGSSEKVKKIALVFRTADRSKEGKTSTGENIYVNVLSEGVNFFSDLKGSTTCIGTKVKLDVFVANPTDLSIKANGSEIASVSNQTVLSTEYTFSTEGICEFVASAKKTDGTFDEEKLTYTVFAAPVIAEYPGGIPKMGAVANADGSVTFCLAAPQKQRVQLVGSWDNYELKDERVMKRHEYQGNYYFWTTVKGLNPDEKYPYYFIVDGSTKVGDPYAKLVLDRTHDGSIKNDVWPDRPKYPTNCGGGSTIALYWGNINKYDWTPFEIPEHHNLVIYEMLFRDFTGDEGYQRGNGNVRKAIEKIPYLKALGINAVELMPIMEFNANNSWGYNTNYYFAPDKAYGSPDDYKEFIDLCHQNGIAVILDIVFNQSDGLHPWYQMYDRNENPFYNAVAPHDYSVLNDWNQDNPIVQQQWDDCLKYWLTEYNVDGFRFDLVKGLGDNDSYIGGTEAFNQSRIDRMKRLHAVIKSVKPNGIHINENLAGASEEKPMGEDGQLLWANFNNNSTKFAQGMSGGNLNQLDGTNYGRPWESLVFYAESHDEERVAYSVKKSGKDDVKNNEEAMCGRLGSLAVQLLLCPGPKMIWQFGELCADQTTKNSSGNNTSPKKVIWSNLENENIRVVHDTYAALCNLRKNNPDLFSSNKNIVKKGLNGAYTSQRTMVLTSGDKQVVAFINPGYNGEAKAITAAADKLTPANAQLICASKGSQPVLANAGDGSLSVNLAPNSYAVFATNNVAGTEDVIADSATTPKAQAYGGNGEIIIVGEYTTAEVYNIQGLRMGRLDGLAKGIYIVRVDDAVAKVAVK